MSKTMRISQLNAGCLAMVPKQRAESGGRHGGAASGPFQRNEQSCGAGIGPFQAQIVIDQLRRFRRQR